MNGIGEVAICDKDAPPPQESEPLPPIYQLRLVRRIFEHARGTQQDGRECLGRGGIEIISLDLPANKIVAILGKSGSGKSTLLNLLGGFIEPDAMAPVESAFKLTLSPAGDNKPREFDLLDKRQNLLRKSAGSIGFVFQHAHLLKSIPVAANVALPQAITGSVDIGHIVELCRKGGTLGFDKDISLDARARTLSGGEAQRVALGRVLLLDGVEVILADEPTANLDPELGADIMAEVAAWQKDGQSVKPRTVIWVTHNIEQAALFADYIVVLSDSRLAEVPAGSAAGDGLLDWPAKNPHDPEVLEAWLHPCPKHRAPAPDAVAKVKNRRDLLLKKAPYRPAGGSGGKKYSSGGVLRRVALAEIFNHRLIDKRSSRWLNGMTSLNSEATQPDPLRWLWSALFVVLAAGMGLALWKGHELRLWAAQTGLPDKLLGGIQAWVFDIALASVLVSAGVVLYSKMFRHKFGKGGQVSAFLLLLLFLAAAVKSYDVVNVMFAKRLAEPDLSHIVVAPTIFSRAEDNETMLRNLAEKQSEAYRIWERSEYGVHGIGRRLANWTGRPWSSSAAPALAPVKSFFPRFESVRLTVGRRADQSSTLPSQTCGNKIADEPEMIALDPKEPMVRQLDYWDGPSLRALHPATPPNFTGPDFGGRFRVRKEGLDGVVVTKSFLKKRLGYTDSELIDPYMCVQLFLSAEEGEGWRVVKILSVVSALPNDSGSDYDVALDSDLYARESARARNPRPDPLYHKIAFYIDPVWLERDLNFFSLLVDRGATGMKAETGLSKIRSAMSAGNAARVFAGGAAFATLLLGIVLIALLANSYLTENERSLCVMRAFGLSGLQTFELTVLQLFIIFLFAFAALTVLLAGVWPYLAGELAGAAGIGVNLLFFQPGDFVLVGGLFLAVLVLSTALVVWSWSRRTRWIAERLQQVG